MTQGSIQFNNLIINEIINFSTSAFDLLFISGPRGCAKSETVNKSIPMLEQDNLIFQHFCYENSAIDDFLLNFYDAMRTFSQSERIVFKKIETDDFKEKVSHYFKSLETNCIIIVENFEKIDGNIEIIDFLSHIARYSNVKIITIARENAKNLFRFKKVKIKNLTISQIDKDSFKQKLSNLLEKTTTKAIEEFYEISQGYELYLKMAIKFCSVTNVGIDELVDEFKRKNSTSKISFEEFLVNKLISLAPANSLKLYKTLSLLRNCVSLDFINSYKIADVSDIDFLKKNLLVAQCANEVFVKDYFKQYIQNSFSIQEKTTYYEGLISIYKSELEKSPKDRLLRLSRESIRKEIEYFSSVSPKVSVKNDKDKFNYLSFSTTAWHDEKLRNKSKLAEKFKKIQERKNKLDQEEKQKNILKPTSSHKTKYDEKNAQYIVELINSSREFTSRYEYSEAIQELLRAKNIDNKFEFEIEILMMIAKNYEYLNDFKMSLDCYDHALKTAIETKDVRVCEIKFEIARLNKSLFKIGTALELFSEIARDELNSQSYRAMSYLEIADIHDSNSKYEEAISAYNSSLVLSYGRDKKRVCKIYYKLGLLYDENQNFTEAIKYYQKNYITSAEPDENKYYSASLVNLASIYSEQGEIQLAIEYLKLALAFDLEVNDVENIYCEQKELAKIYSKVNFENANLYFKEALKTAELLEDDFKIALAHFEYGQCFYDKLDDENALINFLKAKKVLKNKNYLPNDENLVRIDSRIKDIKARMENLQFSVIIDKYEK